MCSNLFKSPSTPKVEQVAPAPTAVQAQEVERTVNDNDKQRRRRGFAATRVADDRAVLTDNATGKRTTLG